jgi:hypothetical protein
MHRSSVDFHYIVSIAITKGLAALGTKGNDLGVRRGTRGSKERGSRRNKAE